MASYLGRRRFLATLGGAAAAWPLAARAQQGAKIPRIGIIDDAPMWQAFRQALRKLGYIEGETVNYEYRYSEGVPDRLATVVGELIRRPVDLIATFGTPPTEAAKAATTTIPIVMIGIGDPVGAGLVTSLAHPGGNITGNTILSPDLGGKRLQILSEAIGSVSRVAYLVNPENASSITTLAELKLAAASAGMTLVGIEVGSGTDFAGAFTAMLRETPDALLVSNDPLHQLHIDWIIDFLAQHRLPGMFQAKENVAAGGLMAYGASVPDLFRRAAGYVHRILQGTKPADLPVELPTKFDLAINLRTARALGLTVPPMLLARADEVIE
ncbi:MAG TPA: ABC transporter substrate-binding protein [Xanthobacteraceae bacterium]|nr:ABC transporter substrate-binding protein [Xanthobacteraceae bacterium]